jgi:hypothetical protein
MRMPPDENTGLPKEKNGEGANVRPLSTERGKHVNDDAMPLAEEVEKEMEDQDIPVETGIPPSTEERRK